MNDPPRFGIIRVRVDLIIAPRGGCRQEDMDDLTATVIAGSVSVRKRSVACAATASAAAKCPGFTGSEVERPTRHSALGGPMIRGIVLSAFVLAMSASFTLDAARDASPASAAAGPIVIAGTWRVTRVQILSKGAVQALIPNDPAYMGAIISFSPSAIRWNAARTNKQGTYSDCALPRFVAAGPRNFRVKCTGDEWSGSTLHAVSSSVMVLDWYDNGVLTLAHVAH